MKVARNLAIAKVSSLAALAMLLVIPLSVSAQRDSRSWMELPRKDAERMLANSPWSQTQVDTDASEMFYSPTRQGTASAGRPNVSTPTNQQSINNNRADRGAVNQ